MGGEITKSKSFNWLHLFMPVASFSDSLAPSALACICEPTYMK